MTATRLLSILRPSVAFGCTSFIPAVVGAALVITLAACGQTTSLPTAGVRPAIGADALAKRTTEDLAKRILEEQLNKEGATFGEIEECQLMATADKNVYNFTLVKAYQDNDENAWEDTFVGTVDVKRRKVKAKRTKHEEV